MLRRKPHAKVPLPDGFDCLVRGGVGAGRSARTIDHAFVVSDGIAGESASARVPCGFLDGRVGIRPCAGRS